MHKLWLSALVSALAAGLILATAGTAAAGKKPTAGKSPVTAEFREPPLGGDGDRIDSDGGGIYDDGVNGVKAYIQPDSQLADFFLDLITTKGARELFVDFGDCVTPGTCSPPFLSDTVFYNTQLQTRAVNLPGLPLGVPTQARLHLNFWAPDPQLNFQNRGWFLRFDPEDQGTSCRSSFVTVTKTSANPDVWVIEADADDEACLGAHGLKKIPAQQRGKYHLPFQVTVRAK